MHKPFLKKILSYLWEQKLESRSSEYNPELHVSLVDGRFQLCTKNAIYSFEDKYANFTKAFKKMKLEDRSIKDVLILGFGLGSIPYMLEKTFNKTYNYTGIEIDEEVISLASKYLIPNMKSRIQILLGDAYQFVVSTSQKFDLIAIDIFQDAVVPKEFETMEFLEMVKNMLSPEGVLMYNRLSHTKEDEEETRKYFDDVFSDVFQNPAYLSISGNWILLNAKNIIR